MRQRWQRRSKNCASPSSFYQGEQRADHSTSSKGEGGKLATIPFAYSYLPATKVWSDNKIREVKTQMGSQINAQSHVFASQIVDLQKEWIDAEVPFLEYISYPTTHAPHLLNTPPESSSSLRSCLRQPWPSPKSGRTITRSLRASNTRSPKEVCISSPIREPSCPPSTRSSSNTLSI